MVDVEDVAAYILQKQGQMSAMKLQKLCYYSQAWHLVWEEQPLFGQRIEAWANGPVVRELFNMHRGRFDVDRLTRGEAGRLSRSERESVDAVLETYGPLGGRQLSYLTHREAPWKDARGNLGPTDASNAEITRGAMADFYGALDASAESVDIATLDWSDWRTSQPDS